MNPIAGLSDDGLVIFLFHGVVERSTHQVRNYTHKHLEKEYFARLMKGLAASGRALSMDELVEHHAGGVPFPPRSFAVTFDDGFENNCSIAAPILADLRIPATFYVTTGFIEHNAMSWIDRIEYCLEHARLGTLRFPWHGEPWAFSTDADKVAILDHLRGRVKRDSSINLDALVAEVFSQCGVHEVGQSDDPLDRKMTWKQVRELHEHPLFTVGGHTHSHRILSWLAPALLDEEIGTSIDLCRRRAGIDLRHYSYPEGLHHCYSDKVIRALIQRGIVCCPTAEPGLNRHTDDLFHLHRNMVTPTNEIGREGHKPACVA